MTKTAAASSRRVDQAVAAGAAAARRYAAARTSARGPRLLDPAATEILAIRKREASVSHDTIVKACAAIAGEPTTTSRQRTDLAAIVTRSAHRASAIIPLGPGTRGRAA